MSSYNPTRPNEEKTSNSSRSTTTTTGGVSNENSAARTSTRRSVHFRMSNEQVNRMAFSSGRCVTTHGDTTTIDQNHQLLIDLLRLFTDQIESDLTIRVPLTPSSQSCCPQLNIDHYSNGSWLRLLNSLNYAPKFASSPSASLSASRLSSSSTSIDQLKESDPLIKSIFNATTPSPLLPSLPPPTTTSNDSPTNSSDNSVIEPEYVTFRVHRNILMCRSRYFRTMLLTDHEWAESIQNQVTIDDISPETAKILLVFIYTGRIEVHRIEQLFEILVSADRFLMDQLVVALHQKIRAEVTLDNALEMYHFSRCYHQGCIHDFCFEFFCKNGYRFLHPNSPLLTLVVDPDQPKVELLTRLLYCNRLCATEDQIAEFVLHYIRVQSNGSLPELSSKHSADMIHNGELKPYLQQELINSIRIPMLMDRAKTINKYLAYKSIQPYRFLIESSKVPLLHDVPRDCYNMHKLQVEVSNQNTTTGNPICTLSYGKFIRIRWDLVVPNLIQLKLSTRYCFNQMQFYLTSTGPCHCVLWSWSHFDDGFDSAESGSEPPRNSQPQSQSSPSPKTSSNFDCCPSSPAPRTPKKTDGWRKLSSNEAYGQNGLVTIKLSDICFANKLRLTLEPGGCHSSPPSLMSTDQTVSASISCIRFELRNVQNKIVHCRSATNTTENASPTVNNNNGPQPILTTINNNGPNSIVDDFEDSNDYDEVVKL